MAVTTMQSPNSLLKRILRDNAAYGFILGDDFIWSPDTHTITYRAPQTEADIWTLLHELAHAKLDHSQYTFDIELIQYEVAAWEYARGTLAPILGVVIQENHIEEHLDTYRYWLHERSMCPACKQNGLQETKNTYSCLNCKCLWRVNEARMCRLKRTRLLSRNHSS